MLKNLIPFGFFINLSLFATNKLHLSAYLCTPSGIPKRGHIPRLGSVCPFRIFFSYPLKITKAKAVSTATYHVSLSHKKFAYSLLTNRLQSGAAARVIKTAISARPIQLPMVMLQPK